LRAFWLTTEGMVLQEIQLADGNWRELVVSATEAVSDALSRGKNHPFFDIGRSKWGISFV